MLRRDRNATSLATGESISRVSSSTWPQNGSNGQTLNRKKILKQAEKKPKTNPHLLIGEGYSVVSVDAKMKKLGGRRGWSEVPGQGTWANEFTQARSEIAPGFCARPFFCRSRPEASGLLHATLRRFVVIWPSCNAGDLGLWALWYCAVVFCDGLLEVLCARRCVAFLACKITKCAHHYLMARWSSTSKTGQLLLVLLCWCAIQKKWVRRPGSVTLELIDCWWVKFTLQGVFVVWYRCNALPHFSHPL